MTNDISDKWFWAYPTNSVDCDGITGSAHEVYLKSEVDAILAHHKYKRCLDKANYWLAVSYNCIDDEHRQNAEKHHYRWLKLAEQFKDKEAK